MTEFVRCISAAAHAPVCAIPAGDVLLAMSTPLARGTVLDILVFPSVLLWRAPRSEYVRFDHTPDAYGHRQSQSSATICPSCQQLQLLCPCLGTCVLTEFYVGLEAGVMESRSVVVVGRGVFEDEEELHFHPIVVACLHRPEQLAVHDNT